MVRRHLDATAIAVTAACSGLVAASGSVTRTIPPSRFEVPGLAAMNTGGAQATSVSCAMAGDCVVGGNYLRVHRNGDFSKQVFVAGEVGGILHNGPT